MRNCGLDGAGAGSDLVEMLVTLDLPDELAERLAERVPEPERNGFLTSAVRRALPRYTEDELAVIAAEVEADEVLTAEMREFDVCAADGLGKHF